MRKHNRKGISMSVAICIMSAIFSSQSISAGIEPISHQINSLATHYYVVSNHSASGVLSLGKYTNLAYGDYGKLLPTSAIRTGTANTSNEPFSWQQEYRDAALSLTYLRARYYQPDLKSFMTMDSYSLDNKYAYGYANPISFVDPSGHISQESALNYVLNGVSLNIAILFSVLTSPASLAELITISIGIAAGTAGIAAQALSDTGAVNAGQVLYAVSSGLGILSLITDSFIIQQKLTSFIYNDTEIKSLDSTTSTTASTPKKLSFSIYLT